MRKGAEELSSNLGRISDAKYKNPEIKANTTLDKRKNINNDY
jgi:hypothetical protein